MIAEHPDVSSNIALLEIWLRAQIAYQRLASVTIGIVHDQELVYAKGLGYANVEAKIPATPDTLYRISSQSKIFTAISIMQLRDQNKLHLDDPITKYLPWFKIRNIMPRDVPITIRHLLMHTSGLPRETGSAYWIDFDFPTIEAVKNKLPELEATYPSETRWKYSNLGPVLTGEIIASVSGQSFASYVEDNILKPLGMVSTSIEVPASQQERLAIAYGRYMPDGTRQTVPSIDTKALAPTAGIASTVADMARYVSWQFRLCQSDQEEVLKASTLREMHRVQWVHPEWKSGWGLGFSIWHRKDRDLVGHGGRFLGYLTNTRISPKEKTGVIVMTNSLDSHHEVMLEKAFEWVTPSIVKASQVIKGIEPDPEWFQYEGTYRTLWADCHIMVLEGKLVMFGTTLADPKTVARTLEPVSDHTFKITGEFTDLDPIGENVQFEMDGAGQVQSILIGVIRAKRVRY